MPPLHLLEWMDLTTWLDQLLRTQSPKSWSMAIWMRFHQRLKICHLTRILRIGRGVKCAMLETWPAWHHEVSRWPSETPLDSIYLRSRGSPAVNLRLYSTCQWPSQVPSPLVCLSTRMSLPLLLQPARTLGLATLDCSWGAWVIVILWSASKSLLATLPCLFVFVKYISLWDYN